MATKATHGTFSVYDNIKPTFTVRKSKKAFSILNLF